MSLLFLWFQKYLSSLVNLYLRRLLDTLESVSLDGMVMEVVRILPTPSRRKRAERAGTCQVAPATVYVRQYSV